MLQFACSHVEQQPLDLSDVNEIQSVDSAQSGMGLEYEGLEETVIEESRPRKPFIESAKNLDVVREGEEITFVADDLEARVDGEGLQLQMYLDLDGEPKLHWVEGGRQYVARSVEGVVGAIDDFLADDFEPQINKSFLRLRMAQVFQQGGDSFFKSDIRLKADLPKVESHMGIVFDSSPVEFETLEGQNREAVSGEQRVRESNNATAALQFMLNDRWGWKFDVDLGLQGSLPINPFLRFDALRNFRLNDNWDLLINNELFSYYQDGVINQSALQFSRPLQDHLIYLNKFELRWLNDVQQLSYADVNSITHVVTDRTVFTYRAAVFFEQKPVSGVTSYLLDFRSRHRLHKDWLYVEFIPSVIWPKDNDFEEIVELTLRFEIFFKR